MSYAVYSGKRRSGAKWIVKKKTFAGLYRTSYMHTSGIKRGSWTTVGRYDLKETALEEFERLRKIGLDKWAVFYRGKAVVVA